MNNIYTSNYRIFNSKIKKEFAIGVISDLHFSSKISNNKLDWLKDYFKKIKPDYLLIPGDLIDCNNVIESAKESLRLLTFLKELGSICLVFISLGNHDLYKRVNKKWQYYYNDEFINKINNLRNVRVLNNTSYSDDNVFLVGLTLPYNYYHSLESRKENKLELIKVINNNLSLIENNQKDKLKLIMIHSPVYLQEKEIELSLKEFDYYISGHMHNGCVSPLIDKIWHSTRGIIGPNKRLMVKNTRNTLKDKNDKLIVNGPLTMFQECSGFFTKFNLLYPYYLSVIKFNKGEKNVLITRQTVKKKSDKIWLKNKK